jgi:hypothetical protein
MRFTSDRTRIDKVEDKVNFSTFLHPLLYVYIHFSTFFYWFPSIHPLLYYMYR